MEESVFKDALQHHLRNNSIFFNDLEETWYFGKSYLGKTFENWYQVKYIC